MRFGGPHTRSPPALFSIERAPSVLCVLTRGGPGACSVQDHAAAAGERDVGNAAAHHAATSRPAGERGIGIASADHADTWRPAGERSQLASLFYKT